MNINDLTAEFHAEYINLDKNLNNADILVIADTRLSKDISDDWVNDKLNNFKMFSRYDSGDSIKHMGILALCSKTSNICTKLPTTSCLRYTEKLQSNKIQTHMQIMVLQFLEYKLNVAFVYIRRKPSGDDISKILENTANCCLVLGDLNLNPQIEVDNNKLIRLCKQDKYLALSEITTNQLRQLDHVLSLIHI